MPPLPSAQLSSEPVSRILIVRLSAHGDIMHTLPLLDALKRENPNLSVGWLTEASGAPLLQGHPQIGRLHISQRKQWLKSLRYPGQWWRVCLEVRAFILELRAERYQISLDVQGLLKSAVWPWLARIPKRYGFKATREGADRFYTHTLPPMNIRDGDTAAVQRYLDFARALGYPVTTPQFSIPPVSEETQRRVRQWLEPLPQNRRLIVLAPFTRWESKHWKTAHWRVLIARLLTDTDFNLAMLGSPNDRQAAHALLPAEALNEQASRVLNLTGETDWPDLYALFQQSDALIGLDSAPLHIADAVGVPKIIGLFGPTAPGRTGPIGPNSSTLAIALDCQPCFEHHCPLNTHACMETLSPEQVFEHLQQQLATQQATGDIAS